MKTTGHTCSQRGSAKSENQDLWLVAEDLGLYAIADGVGVEGREAARIALDAVEAHVRAEVGEDPEIVVREAVVAANAAVFETSQEVGRSRPRMACSLTLALVDDDTMVLAHLGDTRAFLVRDGVVSLTRDDTLRAELVSSGHLEEKTSWSSPTRTVITRAVGMFAYAAPRVTSVPMTQGDRMMLLSKGAYRSATGVRPLWRYLCEQRSDFAAEAIVQSAIDLGENDDVTAVVIDATGKLPESREGLDRLQAHPAFADLPLPHLVRLLNVGRHIQLHVPAELVKTGDPLSTMYIVVSGSLRVAEGDRQSAFGAGSILGYSRLLWSAPSKAEVTTVGPVELITFAQKDVRALAMRRPWAGLRTLFEIGAYLADHPDPL